MDKDVTALAPPTDKLVSNLASVDLVVSLSRFIQTERRNCCTRPTPRGYYGVTRCRGPLFCALFSPLCFSHSECSNSSIPFDGSLCMYGLKTSTS